MVLAAHQIGGLCQSPAAHGRRAHVPHRTLSARRLSAVVGDVIRAAEALGQRLHPRTAASLAELVRVMNCYYSNLAKLVSAGLLVSDTPKGPVRLQFSVESADELFPRLFG